MLYQQLRDAVVPLGMLLQYLFGTLHLRGNNRRRLLVNQFRGLLRIGLGETVVVTPRGVIETDILQFVGHAVVCHHRIRLFGGAFKVVECPRRSLVQEHLFRSTSAQQRAEVVEDMLTVGQLPLLGQVPCRPECHTARHNCNLHQRIAVPQQPRDSGVPCLVISHRAFLLVGHYLVLAFQTAYDTVHRVHKVLFAHFLVAVARSNQCRLVAHVGNVRTRETRGLLGKEVHVHGVVQFQRLQMHLEYLFALLQIRQFHMYLPVETPCTQQGGVQHIGTVGGSQDDDTRVGAEAVHLCQQLVQCRFPLVVASACKRVASAGTPHSVYLVDEDDSRCLLLRLTEQVAHTAGTYTHEHLHEVATRHREERHIRLACHCLGKQRLTCPGRTYQQHALGYLAAEVGVFLRVFEEGDNLLHLLFRACETGNVLERHLVFLVLVNHLRLGFAHAEDVGSTAGTASDAAAHPHEEHHY